MTWKAGAALVFGALLLIAVFVQMRETPQTAQHAQRRAGSSVAEAAPTVYEPSPEPPPATKKVAVPSRETASPASDGSGKGVTIAATYDAKKRYRIALESTVSVPEKGGDRKAVYLLSGQVDGSKFVMKIPQARLDSVSEPVFLSVTNLADGTVQRTVFTFAQELKDTGKTHEIDYYTDHPSDYGYDEKPVRLPGMETD